MLELGAVSSAMESARTILGMAKTFIQVGNSVEVNSVALDLNMKMLELLDRLQDARATESALAQKIQELERELRESEVFQSELENYLLFSPWPGAFVYARKRSLVGAQYPHYLCTNCVEGRVKSILQAVDTPKGWLNYKCPRCSLELQTGSRGGVAPYYPDEP
ncbi:hypothetical protein [Massilia sp. DD77]|uniref:hypothetical protein n=1 Tax=Massilia sp. DD77 TaxID=3109349 RepID=UPI002FFFDC66